MVQARCDAFISQKEMAFATSALRRVAQRAVPWATLRPAMASAPSLTLTTTASAPMVRTNHPPIDVARVAAPMQGIPSYAPIQTLRMSLRVLTPWRQSTASLQSWVAAVAHCWAVRGFRIGNI